MDVDAELARVFRGVFAIEVDDSMSIHTLEAWDSLAHVTLIMALEEAFGVALASWEMIEMTDVPAIKRVLYECIDG